MEVQGPDETKAYDPTMSFPTYPQSDSSRSSSSERCESPPPVRSALAQRFATTRRILNEDLNTEVYAPPSTFPVQPQRLAESSDDDIDDDPGIPVAEPRSVSILPRYFFNHTDACRHPFILLGAQAIPITYFAARFSAPKTEQPPNGLYAQH